MKMIMKKLGMWLKLNGEQQKTKDTSTDYVKEKANKESTLDKADEGEKERENNILIEKFDVDETPFTIIRQDKDWFVMMGRYRITESLSGYIEAEERAKRTDWTTIMQVIGVMIEEYQNLSEIRERLMKLEDIWKQGER